MRGAFLGLLKEDEETGAAGGGRGAPPFKTPGVVESEATLDAGLAVAECAVPCSA